jgi:hypothetical protein
MIYLNVTLNEVKGLPREARGFFTPPFRADALAGRTAYGRSE